jgi:hypothetical protein
MDSSLLRAEQWKARIKWRSGIDIATSTKEQLSEYLNTKLFQATIHEIVDDNLWDLFKHDFKNFNRTAFNRLNLQELLRLRAVLRCGGVYVHQDHKNLSIAQSLVNLIQEKEQHIWSAADIDKARADLQKGPITSVFISLKRGNQRLQPPGQPLTSAYLRHLAELERFHRAHRALPITKALPIKALPVKSTNDALEALPIKALSIKALPVDTDTNEPALPVDTDTNKPPKPDSFTFEALPLDIDERNQLAVPSTEPSIFPLETYEPVDTDNPLETDELAIPSANTTEPSMEGTFTLETDEPSVEGAFTLEIDERAEPSVEDALTFKTLTSPPSPLRSIPATGFGQLHTLQRTNGSTTPTYTSATPTFTEFGRFQALQRTGVG